MPSADQIVNSPVQESVETRAVALPKDIHYSFVEENHWQLLFDVDEQVPGVKEHFPQMRLIAGYMQMLWVEQLFSGISPEFKLLRITDVKFYAQITPPTSIVISIKIDEQKSSAQFEIADSEGVKTKGRLALIADDKTKLGSADVC